MEQAGVLNITFYEDKSLNIVYNASNEIENIYTGGDEITITNDGRIKFSLEPVKSNNKLKYNYNLEFLFWDLTLENYEQIKTIKKSIYGWKPLITFYNGDVKFINNLFSFVESRTENKEANFSLNMRSILNTIKDLETVNLFVASNNYIFEDGNNYIYEDGNNYVFNDI